MLEALRKTVYLHYIMIEAATGNEIHAAKLICNLELHLPCNQVKDRKEDKVHLCSLKLARHFLPFSPSCFNAVMEGPV